MSKSPTALSRHPPLVVLYWPKWPDQPYLEDLAAGLANAGVESRPLTAGNLLRYPRSVVHIHWPETIVSGMLRVPRLLRPIARAVRLVAMAAAIGIGRVRRQALVVTLHNLRPHDSDARLPVVVLRQIARRADVVVALTRSGARRARQLYPELQDATIELVPHMDFAQRYPPVDRVEARLELGIPPDAPVIVFFGRVQPYKGVERLAASFLELDGSPHLLILGYGHLTDPRITSNLMNDERVHWHNEWVAEQQVSSGLGAGDLAVFPFRHIENSGSVIAALASGIRVLVPDVEPMRELATAYGDDRLLLFDGELSAATLQRRLDETPDRKRTQPVIPERTLDAVGARQREVYELALERSGQRGARQ